MEEINIHDKLMRAMKKSRIHYVRGVWSNRTRKIDVNASNDDDKRVVLADFSSTFDLRER